MFLHRAVASSVPVCACPGDRPHRTVHGPAHLLTQFIKGIVIMTSVAAAPAFAQSTSQAASTGSSAGGTYNLIIGTYTGGNSGAGKSEGLYVYHFDTQTGDAQQVSVAKTVNPSFLVVSKDNRFAYAVNELPGDNGPASLRGDVSAFVFDAASGRLTFLNKVSAQGNDPCYLSLSPDGRYLFVANYSVAADPGGSFAVLPVQHDGKLGEAVLIVHHEGGGPVKGRQDNAHVHSTVFSPDGHYLFAQDLGTDKLWTYRYAPDGSRDVVSPAEWLYTGVKAGSGARHLVFGNDGRHAYLTSELAATVTVFAYHDGRMNIEQVEKLAEPGFKGTQAAAALHLSPDGRFLYVSNRGDANDISIFAVDGDSGKLRRVGRQSSLGKAPREFAIDPTGQWLIVGNQNSDTAFVFRRDQQTGLLEPNPKRIDIGSPVDFKFVAR